ncbi:MAG: hypothetical protein ACRDL8_23015, partial [Solirubrobacteraceae bacterium]
VAAIVAAGAGAGLTDQASAAPAPPMPTAANGHAATVLARGVATPTSFAFDPARRVAFIGAFGDERTGKGGGAFTLARHGQSVRIAGVPAGVAGMAFHKGTLYVSVLGQKGGKILALGHWNGQRFGTHRTIFDARSTVGAASGLAWGPDGRLYAGSGLVNDIQRNGKVKRSPFPHPYTVFSIKPNGRDFRVEARGLRQPFQLTFVKGSRAPYVSVLSQETRPIPPDAIVKADRGREFGFPSCFAGVGIGCKGAHFDKPLIRLPRHASPMGIQSRGHTLYVALFGGIAKSGPEVVTVAARQGAKPKPLVTGFPAPVVALGLSHGTLYAGDLTGTIYAV